MTDIAIWIVQLIFVIGLFLVLLLLAPHSIINKIYTWLDHRYMRKQLTILFTNHYLHNLGREPNYSEMHIFTSAIEPLIRSDQYVEALERTKLIARTIVKSATNIH